MFFDPSKRSSSNANLPLAPSIAGWLCLWGLVSMPASLFGADLPAFPTAVGQGAKSTGGRGGDVYHVTNLQDYSNQAGEEKIPGSLRHAIRSADGPRTIVFDVGGVIPLASRLKILKDNITIAGQTAPGGITLYGYPVEISQSKDVILRYLRIRTGDFHAEGVEGKPGRGNQDLTGDEATALRISNGSGRVIVDHLSVTWGMDEALSVTDSHDVTVQHCLIAESLEDSFHPKGLHGYGSLVRGSLTPAERQAGSGGYTFFGNLWAHHRARNPSLAGQQHLEDDQSEEDRGGADVNLVNNVVYNWRERPTHRSTGGSIRVNLIGNYYVSGPDSEDDTNYIFNNDNPGATVVYQEGNLFDADKDPTADGQLVGVPENPTQGFEGFENGGTLIGSAEGSPFAFFNSVENRVLAAEEAYRQVVNEVGASLSRDMIDRRIVQSLQNREGGIIDSQESFRTRDGTLPGIDDLPTQYRPNDFDTDRDGMPNEFEEVHGLDPNDPKDRNGDELSDLGYTNLEVYLNSLVKEAPTGAERE